MTEEQKRLLEEMKSMGENLRAANIDFIISLNVPTPNVKHFISTEMNCQDDHHVLDMLSSIQECWWKANH